MAYTLASATRGATDWGALALLFLLTGGATGYAVALAFRARSVARQGWAGFRAHPWPLIRLLCDTPALAFAVSVFDPAWLARPTPAGRSLRAAVWTETAL